MEKKRFLRCRSSSGGVLGASWAILSALWKPLGDVSGAPVGHLGSSRGIEKGQDAQDALECILGANLGPTWITPWGARSARASEASEARRAPACNAKQTEEMR